METFLHEKVKVYTFDQGTESRRLGKSTRLVFQEPGSGVRFHFRLASNRESREKAYRLAYQVYGNAGLGQANPDNLEMIVTPQDQNPDTFTLLVEDDAGMPAATISIFYDFGRRALPCYELYPEETRRFCGGKTAEVCRLAIAEKYRHLNSLVTHMINVSFLHGFLQKTEDCLIEVHPRHAAFYRRFLLFELLGSEKPCGRVNGSPALLLHLPMGRFRKEVLIGRSAKKAGQNLPRKNSYHAFVGETEEKVLIRYLRNQMTPMSHEEKKYFQIFTG